MREARCASCRFFRAKTERDEKEDPVVFHGYDGECRRNAPRAGCWPWPVIRVDDNCGEYVRLWTDEEREEQRAFERLIYALWVPGEVRNST